MTRRNKSKVKTKVKAGNALLHGAGASTWQDRGSLQQGAIISKNPYYNNDYYRRWQDWVRWYYTDWAARKVVDIPINDAFRIEPQLKGMDEDTTEALLKYQEAMGGRDKLRKAATQERLLGGSLVLLGIRQQDDDASIPLDYDKIDKGDLVFMNVVSVEKISQVEYETDPFSPMFNTPKYYMINGRKVHISRLIVFDGNPLFNIASMNILQNFRFNPAGFGESVLTTLFDSLVRFAGTQEGAYHLVNMASVLLVKCDRLLELQSTNLGDRAIDALNRMAEQISIYRAGVLQGKDVEVAQHSATFGSVPELLQTFAQILAAGSDIPATRFLGQAPGGLNATGESDLENYYNNIASWQNIRLKPRELQMYDIMGRSCFGREKWLELKPGFDIEYAPLWNLSETEQATVDRTRAETIDLLANAGYLSREKALDELKARKIFMNDIEAEDMPDMSELGYMSGYGEQPNTPEQNNELLGKMAQIGNIWVDNPDRWITMKSQPVPVEGGQSSKDAAKAFLTEKGRSFKERGGGESEKKESAIEKLRTATIPLASKRQVEKEFGTGQFGREMESLGQEIKSLQMSYAKNPTEENAQAILDKADEFNKKASDYRQEKREKDARTKEASEFEVVKETAKARQLRKDGKTFWIQKKWQREDGSLTPAGQKAFEEERTDEQKAKDKEDYIQRRKEGVARPAKADWESEKAYGYDLNLDFYDAETSKRHRIFVPKSIIQENGNIPTWFIEKKMQELEDTYPSSRYGGFAIMEHPFIGTSLGKRDWSSMTGRDDYDDDDKKETKNKVNNLLNAVVYSVQNSILCKSHNNGETWEECKE